MFSLFERYRYQQLYALQEQQKQVGQYLPNGVTKITMQYMYPESAIQDYVKNEADLQEHFRGPMNFAQQLKNLQAQMTACLEKAQSRPDLFEDESVQAQMDTMLALTKKLQAIKDEQVRVASQKPNQKRKAHISV